LHHKDEIMDEILKNLSKDSDGMMTYEYIANNVSTCSDILPELIENMKRVDHSGQFVASTARFLAAIDKEHFSTAIAALIESAIEKDRELRYLGSLLKGIWGADYETRANELRESDDNFRRIYKRIYSTSVI